MIAADIIAAIREALDTLAPEKRVQIKHSLIDFLTQETKDLQYARDVMQTTAHTTGSQEDWRIFRRSRNIARQAVKNNKRRYYQIKLSSGDPNQVWDAARKLAGVKVSGPPTRVTINGRPETSPQSISDGLNENFI